MTRETALKLIEVIQMQDREALELLLKDNGVEYDCLGEHRHGHGGFGSAVYTLGCAYDKILSLPPHPEKDKAVAALRELRTQCYLAELILDEETKP